MAATNKNQRQRVTRQQQLKKTDKDNHVAAANKNQTMTITWQQQIKNKRKTIK